MRCLRIAAISLLCILLVLDLGCTKGSSHNSTPSPTPTPSLTITASPTSTLMPTPTATLGPEGCEADRDAIQAALHSYHHNTGSWPTADGDPGDIMWSRLVPDYLPYTPHTDTKCDWQVNTDPEGEVCLWALC